MDVVYCKVKESIRYFIIKQALCEVNLDVQTFENIKKYENIIVVPSTGMFLDSIKSLAYDCNLLYFVCNFTTKLIVLRLCLSVT